MSAPLEDIVMSDGIDKSELDVPLPQPTATSATINRHTRMPAS
jgi:hypothetical protein